MSMDLRQLEALLAISDHGSFSAAADALHTVQSNISARIARLEASVGAELVNRTTRSLTPEGAIVAARARTIVSHMDAIHSDIAGLRDVVIGQVTLGIHSSTARWLVPPLLADVATRFPEVELLVTEAASNDIVAGVGEGKIDLGVVNLPLERHQLQVTRLFEEDILLVLPVGHMLVASPEPGVEDLDRVPLLAAPEGSAFRDELNREFAVSGARMVAAYEFNGIRLIESLAVQGVGAALLPASAVPADHEPTPRKVRGISRRTVGLVNRQGTESLPSMAVGEAIRRAVGTTAPSLVGIYAAESTPSQTG